MKKILLSAVLIFVFGAYALYKQTEAKNPVVSIQTNQSSSTQINTSNQGKFKDGVYTGDRTDAFYGFIQVKATIQGGKLTDLVFLEYPNDRQTSVMINQAAISVLKSEAITAQNAQVDIVSGATQSSEAFIQSLKSALTKAS